MRQQLTLFNLENFTQSSAPIYDPAWDIDDSLPTCKSVGEQVTDDTEKSAPQHDKATHWVEEYWVQRSNNKYWYYRYCFMTRRKIHRIYIGSVNSHLAQRRKQAVEEAIKNERSPSEIEQLIRSWR